MESGSIKVIKSESEYQAVLAEIEALVSRDPDPGTPDADRLELLTLLAHDYEAQHYEAILPTPIEAINFRMEQQGLTPRDLIPYIGSRSKVSEVLSGKRPLTVSMMRALYQGLGIPAKVLLQERRTVDLEQANIEWERFPIREMIARKWIQEPIAHVRREAEDIMLRFLRPLGSMKAIGVLYRKTATDHVRSARSMDKYALFAWTARIVLKALKDLPQVDYKPGSVNLQFMQEVARLSWSDVGPTLAIEYLRKYGISLVVEAHLPRTYLDGAAIMYEGNKPIIGLSLRHDRIDNFWFCLMHELAHLSLHLGEEFTHFYDDLDVESRGDPREREADELASEALIPLDVWTKSAASRLRTAEAAERLANELRIHPAIVGGRVRKHFRDYRVLGHLVGHGDVRKHFRDVAWN